MPPHPVRSKTSSGQCRYRRLSNNRCAMFFNEPNSSTAVRFPCSWAKSPQQAPLLHQLQQQVGDLQQEIVRRPARVAVGMFQVQAAVLLGVKSLVLRRASVSLPPSVATSTTVSRLDLQ